MSRGQVLRTCTRILMQAPVSPEMPVPGHLFSHSGNCYYSQLSAEGVFE